MAGMAWKLKLNWIKFSYFSCRGKREFSYIDLIQITLLITTDGLLKRICQPDIKFYVYLCINVLRDIRRSKGNIVASVSLIRLEGNVEILQILVVCEEYWFKWWIRVRNIYIFLHKFRCYWFICYCFIFSDEYGYLCNMILGNKNVSKL